MTRFIFPLSLVALLALACSSADAARKKWRRDIMGLRIEMSEKQAHQCLQNIGKLARAEEHRQEVWEVRDESFSHLIVGFDAKDELRYVTAIAREDKESKRIAYSDIGNLEEAQALGDPKIKNFAYQWTVPAGKDQDQIAVIVRGRDPKFLSTYSIKRIESDGGGREED